MAPGRKRALAAMALSLGMAGPGCAPLPQHTLLCQRPEVLQEVGRVLHALNVYDTVDENTAREAPTARADAVVCTADRVTLGYARTATGWDARPVRMPIRYDVQVNGNRFAVQVVP